MTSPRIPLLDAAEAQRVAAEARVPGGFAELNVFRVLLQQPRLAKSINDLLVTLLFKGTLEPRLRELVIMRIGWATGSVYEWTQHWRIARELGVSEEDLLALRDWRAHAGFTATDRAVLAATDETLENGSISSETWAACAAALPSHQELLELVGAIGCWHFVSQLLRSLDVPLEDGVADWPPDGVAP